MPAPQAGRAGSSGAEAFAWLALVAGAAALRWLAWTRTAVLFDDGPRFLAIARAMDAGWWPTALRDSFHPLYPALTAGLHRLLGLPDTAGGWETAGALVGVAGGAAAVGFLLLFLRDAFGRAPAWVGALLLAVHGRAVEYGSDVQSDGLYLGLFTAGLAAGWRAWRSGAPGWAAAAGVAAGLAYLTRPEGLGLALVLVALGLASVLRGRWTLRAGAAWCTALLLATAACAAPYVLALHAYTGVWALTHKKSLAVLVGAEEGATPGAPAPAPAPPPAAPTKRAPASPATPPPAAPTAPSPESVEAADPRARSVPLAAPSSRAEPAPPPPSAPAPATPAGELRPPARAPAPPWLDDLGLHTPAPAQDEMEPGYLAQDGLRVALAPSAPARAWEAARMLLRHARSALQYGVLALVVAGVLACRGRPAARGLYVLTVAGLYLSVLYALTVSVGYVSRRHALPPLVPLFGYAGIGALALGGWLAQAAGAPGRRALAGALVVAAFAGGELAGSLEPKRLDELAERRAAEWLRAHAPARGTLAASRQRFGYYAGMPFVPLTGIADEALGGYLSRVGVRYVLVEDAERLEALRLAEGGAIRVLHHVAVAGQQAWVVEREAAAPAGD